MQDEGSVYDPGRRSVGTVLRFAALILLLSSAAIWESLHLHSFQNPEVWGHLRAGAWILQNQSWPETGIFSQAAKHPWRDFSWGYDVLLAIGHRLLGLRIIPACLISFRVALALVTFFLAGGPRNFWRAVVLSGIAQYVFTGSSGASTGISVIFFGIELSALLIVWRTENRKLLFVLPILFLFWANLDMGFVYGIALYVLFLVALVLQQATRGRWPWFKSRPSRVSTSTAALAGAICVLTSLVSPYGYNAYWAFVANHTRAVNVYLPDYAAMRFHQPQDYVLLLLAMTAFLRLGARRRVDLFQIMVLVGCMASAFHSQRDNWLLVLAATAFIGESMLASREPLAQPASYGSRQAIMALAASVVMVALGFEIWVPRQDELLLAEVAKHYPVRASEYIRQHGLPMPLFNSYAWGSFLTWYLPEYPVAIDGRRDLYADDQAVNYFRVMKAEMPYQDYSPMSLARTLLLNRTEVMAEALRTLPGFQVAYEDEISVVLLRDRPNNERGR